MYCWGYCYIASCTVVRDWEIQVDSHLKFHEHTTAVTKNADRLLSIIHKIFHYFDKVNLYLSTYTKLIFDLFWNMKYHLGTSICLRPATSGKSAEKSHQIGT